MADSKHSLTNQLIVFAAVFAGLNLALEYFTSGTITGAAILTILLMTAIASALYAGFTLLLKKFGK